MIFQISSKELATRVQNISRVINKKNTNLMLNNIMFEVGEKTITMTAACEDMHFQTSFPCYGTVDAGTFAVNAALLNDAMKEIPEQPIAFNVNGNEATVTYMNGVCNFPVEQADAFPLVNESEPYNHSLTINAGILAKGLAGTSYACGEDDIRPIMNSVYFDLTENGLAMVASDGHKLAKFTCTELTTEQPASFVMPHKMVVLVKGIAAKSEGTVVSMEFNGSRMKMTVGEYVIVGRLIEGRYPNYNAVIPKDLPYSARLDRQGFISALRRMMVFANETSGLIALSLEDNKLTLNAEDIDFSSKAEESINCDFNASGMSIGFKGDELVTILSNIESDEVVLKLAEETRPGILTPAVQDENEDLMVLLMPMLINS